jgi:hypothetical protein
MRAWVIAKLTWDSSRDVSELIQDFAWGHYGNAALAEYDRLLQQTGQDYKGQLLKSPSPCIICNKDRVC